MPRAFRVAASARAGEAASGDSTATASPGRPGLGEGEAELAADRLPVQPPAAARSAARLDRLAGPLELAQGEGEVLVGLREVRPLGDHLAARGRRPPRSGGGSRRPPPGGASVDPDEGLGIVGGGVGRLRRPGAGRVAEAAQPRLLLRPTRPPWAAARPTPAAARRAGRGPSRRSAVEQVLLLPGVRGQVVELRQRQVDELPAVAQQAAQRRPAAVERGARATRSRRRALRAAGGARSERPGRRGPAARSRLQRLRGPSGTMSTWRAGRRVPARRDARAPDAPAAP